MRLSSMSAVTDLLPCRGLGCGSSVWCRKAQTHPVRVKLGSKVSAKVSGLLFGGNDRPTHTDWRADERTRTADLISLRVSLSVYRITANNLDSAYISTFSALLVKYSHANYRYFPFPLSSALSSNPMSVSTHFRPEPKNPVNTHAFVPPSPSRPLVGSKSRTIGANGDDFRMILVNSSQNWEEKVRHH